MIAATIWRRTEYNNKNYVSGVQREKYQNHPPVNIRNTKYPQKETVSIWGKEVTEKNSKYLKIQKKSVTE